MKTNMISLKMTSLMMVASGALFAQSQFPAGGDPNYYPQQGGYNQGPGYDQSQYPQQYPPQYQQQYPVQPAYGVGVAVRPPMPGPGYIWVDGYYDAYGQFIAGYWAVPPYSGAYWIGPGFFGGRWTAGYWGGSRGFAGGGFRGGVGVGFREGFHESAGFRGGGNEGFHAGFRGAPRAEFHGGGQSFHAAPAPAFHGGGQTGGSSQGGHGRR